MFNIADLPAVRAQLAQDAAAAERSSAGEAVVDSQQGSNATQPQQTRSYPSKSLVLVDGRYQAVEQKK